MVADQRLERSNVKNVACRHRWYWLGWRVPCGRLSPTTRCRGHALWNRTRTRADALAEKLRNPPLEVYDSWQELITRAHCDVISIATAPLLRSGPLLMALDQGCHVLVGKPMSVGVREAERMVAAARTADCDHGGGQSKIARGEDDRPPGLLLVGIGAEGEQQTERDQARPVR